MTGPECHGAEMDCLEYDPDEDLYTFRCDTCGHHIQASDDDEVWK